MIVLNGAMAMSFEERVRTARDRISSVRVDGKAVRVTMPVTYPNGNMAAIELTANGDLAFITDMGMGHLEAEYSGADLHYRTQAKSAAERYGISFDGYNVFAIKVPIAQLESAMVAVANASVNAATNAIYKALEEKSKASNEDLYGRLTAIFGNGCVDKVQEIRGLRDSWEAHNVITLKPGGKAIFEIVHSHQSSVASKYYMFSDLKNSEQDLSLTSVVDSLESFSKAKGQQLADISHIIPVGAKNDQFEKFANWMNAA